MRLYSRIFPSQELDATGLLIGPTGFVHLALFLACTQLLEDGNGAQNVPCAVLRLVLGTWSDLCARGPH